MVAGEGIRGKPHDYIKANVSYPKMVVAQLIPSIDYKVDFLEGQFSKGEL